MNKQGIGASVLRKEDKRFITGKGKYTDDHNIAKQHYACFVRSPHAHAKIKNINTEKAQNMPGIVGIFNGKELIADGIGNIICGWNVTSKDGSPMNMGAWSALAGDTVRYVGDAVCIVLGETLAQAKAAAEAVQVEYQTLPAVINSDEAIKNNAIQIHDNAKNNISFDWEIGEADKVQDSLKNSEHIVEIELTNNRLVANPMEPRAALVQYDSAQDHYTLHTTSQNPHVARLVLSAFYQVAPEHKLRVVAPDVGGGFGAKIYIYPEEIACLWAAKKAGIQALKWTAERTEAFLTDAHGRDHISKAKIGFDKNHKIQALQVETLANLGAYMSLFSSAVPTYLYATLLSGQYDIPQIHCNVKAVYTNTVPVDAYRGAGRPEATFLLERLMEVSARQLNIDPAELRRKNFITEFPHQTPVIMCYDSGNYNASLDAAMQAIDYNNFAKRREHSQKNGMLRGIGMACYIEACGIAPSAAVGSLGAGVGLWESAEVRVNPVGTIEILTGSHSHGQGHETTFAQLISERFGLPIENVEVIHGDTDKVQFGMGTYGSRSGAVGMSAIFKALDKVEGKVKTLAAHLLESNEKDIEIEQGEVLAKGTNKKLAWHELCLAAYTAHNLPDGMEPGLKEGAFYDPANFTFPAGCYICEVEIDPNTGKVQIERFVAADDFGTIINPMIVAGQVHGGLTQGIGQALLEHAVYDDSGQLLSGSYMDYTMPRADDVPSFEIFTTETTCPNNPLGVKGCGEAGAIGSPPAVINAITNAIGHEAISMPATSCNIWQAINNQQHQLKQAA